MVGKDFTYVRTDTMGYMLKRIDCAFAVGALGSAVVWGTIAFASKKATPRAASCCQFSRRCLCWRIFDTADTFANVIVAAAGISARAASCLAPGPKQAQSWQRRL